MKRMKLFATLVCALAVLAFAGAAWAHDDWLDDDHIDDPENGKYVFWDEEEMMEFLAEWAAQVVADYDDEEGGGLDSEYQTPIPYAVSTYHMARPAHWHVDTNVVYLSGEDVTYHRVCTNGVHMYQNVYAFKTHWKTNQSGIYNYCAQGGWYVFYKKLPLDPWKPFTNSGCWYVYPPPDVVYWGEEPSGVSYYNGPFSYNYHLNEISAWYWSEHRASFVVTRLDCP